MANDSEIFVDFDDLCEHSLSVASSALPAVTFNKFSEETLNLENDDWSALGQSLAVGN